MLTIYKTIDNVVVKQDEITDGAWVNLVKPTQSELDYVIAALSLDEGFAKAALDPEETSRLEIEDYQSLLIIDIPMMEKVSESELDENYGTIPMGIISTKNNVVTICLYPTSILSSIESGKVKNIYTNLKTRFIFQILLRVAGKFLAYLRRIDRKFTKIERSLYKSFKNEELIELLTLSKSLVYFSASLKANEVTMEKVLRGRALKLYEDDKDLLEDALIEVRQANEMASIYSSILSTTMDAYSSVVSNNLNMIMKVLTVITIILTVPNIIFSFYGMNVASLPGDTFWWLPVGVAACLSLLSWLILKKGKIS